MGDEVDLGGRGEAPRQGGRRPRRSTTTASRTSATDASCRIRPQSLLGEKYVDCTPTQPQGARDSEPPPELEVIEDGEPGEGQRLLPVENNGTSVDIDLFKQHQPAALPRALPAHPQRARRRRRRPGRGPRRGHRPRQPRPPADRPGARDPRRAEPAARLAGLQRRHRARAPRPRARAHHRLHGQRRRRRPRPPRSARPSSRRSSSGCPRFLRELRLTMKRPPRRHRQRRRPVFARHSAPWPRTSPASPQPGPVREGGDAGAHRASADAGQAAGPKLVAADPLTVDLTKAAVHTAPIAQNLKGILRTFEQTNGIKNLLKFIRFSTTAANGFDSFGHFLRTNVLVTSCIDTQFQPASAAASPTGRMARDSVAPPPRRQRARRPKPRHRQGTRERRADAARHQRGDPRADPAAGGHRRRPRMPRRGEEPATTEQAPALRARPAAGASGRADGHAVGRGPARASSWGAPR